MIVLNGVINDSRVKKCASSLKNHGYATAHIGKWHINHPVKPVFDKTYNEINGLSDYFPGSDGKIYGVDGHRKGKKTNRT